jgi:hypothetical protein
LTNVSSAISEFSVAGSRISPGAQGADRLAPKRCETTELRHAVRRPHCCFSSPEGQHSRSSCLEYASRPLITNRWLAETRLAADLAV